MIRYIVIAMFTAMLLVQQVSAAVLTADNKAQLCKNYNNRQVVDKDVLAFIIAIDAGAGLYLDGSNALGLRDGIIQLRSDKGTLSEPAYAILNCLSTREDAKNQPFGPNVNLQSDKRASKACDEIQRIMSKEIDFLTINGSLVNGKVKYRIERRTTALAAPTEQKDWFNPQLLFQDDSPLVIFCEESENTSSPPVTTPENSQQQPVGISTVNLIRLRGTVKDLTVKASDLKSAKPATITYQNDRQAEKETFGINGLLGIRFGDSDGVVDVIPFVSYENRSITGGKGNVEKLSPGLLFGYKLERPAFALHTRLEASLIEDLLNDSKQVKLRVYADPAFALGKGQGVLFGSYLKPFYQLQWRPDMTLIGDLSHVNNAGTNQALSAANNYFGLGGELSLRARLDLGQPISDFDLQGGVRYLRLLGDINKQEARRWFCTLNYAPANFPYIGIAFSFSKGENDDTFQDEDIYSINLTVRY